MIAVNAASKAEIDMIHSVLNKKYSPLYADVWKVGVNLSLRISDLLNLKYADLNLADRSLKLIEAKTGKPKIVRLNALALAVIARRQQEHSADTWLFQVHSNRVFKEAGDRLGLSINTHSMRKSRGMAMYSDGVPIEN